MDLLDDYELSTNNPDPNATAQISPIRSQPNSNRFPQQSYSRGFSVSNDSFNPSDGDGYDATSPAFNPGFSTPLSNFQSQPPMPPLASVLGIRQRTESMNELSEQPSKRLRATAATEAMEFLALSGPGTRIQNFAQVSSTFPFLEFTFVLLTNHPAPDICNADIRLCCA